MLPTNSIFRVDQHYESLTKPIRFAFLAQRLLFFPFTFYTKMLTLHSVS